MSTKIHPNAIIEEGAQIGEDVTIGPFSIIGSDVELGDGNYVESHVVINGHTSIGENNHFFPYCAIGGVPQSLSYKEEPTQTQIGSNNVFRENMTVSRGTVEDEGVTSIGDDNFFMAYCHVAHDCRLGSSIMFANSVCLAGHVHLGDHVVMSGYSLVHQFCRVGHHAFMGPSAVAIQDVPPYTLAAGNRAITHGINVKGLRRRGLESEDITQLKRAYKIIYRSGFTLKNAMLEIEEREFSSEHVKYLTDFIQGSQRGVIR
ncbi:MAG: acyl-ACP--UDP-N-acetylglucosamine O-acyltransferase [Acidiferrobacterales bacterium]|nr:acyl-ACP--UDP-N-acetylglucosamine O-acyltransferase [Acidiferrobacterales bacterium]